MYIASIEDQPRSFFKIVQESILKILDTSYSCVATTNNCVGSCVVNIL